MESNDRIPLVVFEMERLRQKQRAQKQASKAVGNNQSKQPSQNLKENALTRQSFPGNAQTSLYPDRPVGKLEHSPNIVEKLEPKIEYSSNMVEMPPPSYECSQYQKSALLPGFESIKAHNMPLMIQNHSNRSPSYMQGYHMIPGQHGAFHSYPQAPLQHHTCSQGCHLQGAYHGPPCYAQASSMGPLTNYCGMNLNSCTLPQLKPPSSHIPVGSFSQQRQQEQQRQQFLQQNNFQDYGEPHSPVDNLDNHLDLGVGSMVEVTVDGVPYHGVIRWTGQVYAAGHTVAGIEMEEEHDKFCDGMMNNKQRFHCNPKRGHFVPLFQCRLDSRFIESHCPGPSASSHMLGTSPDREFGGKECPIIPGAVAPINVERDIENYCGKFCGIQGHHNSCYLDATLFAMFTFTSVFDNLLFRPAPEGSSPQYTTVQQVLREEIVNPLRTNLFVRADKVMRLRRLLNELSSVSGLTTEEKDPEEFLTSLVAQILRAEPFLKLSSGQEAYHYQLFVEKDKNLTFPTVQQLFEQSFLTSDIKLKEVPSCLIIQMPRFGKSYKMYPRILPSQLLDITDVLEDSPRQCAICGKLAEFECRKCFNQCDVGLQSLWYCQTCLDRTHTHEKRTDHESCWRRLELPDYFRYDQECTVPRLFMELFAVVCIETSHYVAFVKGGSGCEAPWCFFDSMADRKGERNGYNIPEMVPCSELPHWLSDEGSRQLNEIPDDRQLPEYAKRLMCDAYMCMYQSTDVMMYR
ncbi:hypothetical protein M8J76_014361 [Diaphorina citri]|nr:hypothetical protein M8J76_014361 [Diaphorina citri]KAI5743570.1 hypothetical protein M8J77_019712 [Diaphorina citri]